MSIFPTLDIVTNILCCLPVKSLVRLKRVSKSWHSLNDIPCFINLPLACSIATNDLLPYIIKIQPSFTGVDYLDFASLHHNDGAREQKLDTRPSKYACKCGSCNGLFALHKKDTKEFGFFGNHQPVSATVLLSLR
ncbi:hypothetical protein NC653_026547 [Populus alba x Populus x berolinensis]|uniref:F-box domain-containing protein n=1 Tax=Populus alba x Populus x berolinensis TaxID=444605 RepID=A0AAD6Q9D6_9ROSI|nr:hypothetical protein NC653_026547 [Populus alba x Populus x berolinensis]